MTEKYSPSPLPCVVDNSLHGAGPLPPRGEGVRRGIFTPLLIKSKKEVILQHLDEKNMKYFSSLLNKYEKRSKNAGY
jgi:hypothetical protein